MPLIHAEDLDLQAKSMGLYQDLIQHAPNATVQMFERFGKVAKVHQQAIATFGRYPERNQYLSRTSTPEEIAYLKG
eukprot:m.4219 g.4219  ORF g.4219 m.4219 type:complete len:76 (+) comp4928_c0_seq1:442-669(+)